MTIPTMPLFDAVILFEQEPGNVSFLKACNPADFDFSDEMDILVHNAFSYTPSTCDKIFIFNCHNYFCYTWLIVLPVHFYSIVVLSKLKVPSVFLTFLDSLEKEFTRNVTAKFDPLPTLDYTYSLLKSWKWVDKKVILAHLPDSAYNITFEKESFCFPEYDPSTYFPKKEMAYIWKIVVTGVGLHIIADFDILYESTFAAISLSLPLQYKELILITQNPDDERLQNLSDYAIVATTPNIDLSFYKFAYTIEVKNKIKNPSSKETRQEYKARTLKLLDVSIFMMDRMLRKQPYNDILKGPFITDDAEALFENKKRKTRILDADSFRLIENTRTFQNYREKVKFRPTFRQNILSVKPADVLQPLSLQHLKTIESILPELEQQYQNDKHFLSVLAIHSATIKKLLGKKSGSKVQNQQSSPEATENNGRSSRRHFSCDSESGAPQFSPYMGSEILESVLKASSSDLISPDVVIPSSENALFNLPSKNSQIASTPDTQNNDDNQPKEENIPLANQSNEINDGN